MARETDFFKFLKLLRVTDFLSKLVLRKYQRNLVPYFKKYLLTEIDGDKKKSIFDAENLGSTAQSLLEDNEESEILKYKRLELISTVNERFNADESSQDLAILYEITGYQGENPPDDPDFWSNYANYKVVMSD